MTVMSQIYQFGPFRLDAQRGDLMRGNTPVAVGGRAVRLLEALLARPGELVSKDELMAAGWPGRFVEEGNLAMQIRSLRQILGDQKAPHVFIVTVSGRGYRFVGEVTRPAAAPVLGARRNKLPLPTSALIGREADLAALRGLLARHRLVTVLGPGGIGKTRLAVQTAAEAQGGHADGVFLVEFAGVSQAEQVPSTAAGALDITLSGGGDPAERFASALRGAAMLIILDNCEHLIEAVSALAEAVLRRNAAVKILATSRSPLGLPGEQIFALPALAVPDAAALPDMTAEDAASYAGVQLFVARAALVQPGFALDAGNAADIAAICLRLDGIALAIELAAARTPVLRPKDLLVRLNDRFRLLTGGDRTRLPRQKTLRALIDWSFDLLTESERIALRRLGVFAGSFDLAGAEAVLPGGPIEALDVLDLVTGLLDKSLVVRLPAQHHAPRYRLLDTTRHYALEKLCQAGETAALHRAHARHMVTWFGAARRRYPDTDTFVWYSDVQPEIENLLAALDWAFGDNGDDGVAVALAARLRPVQAQGLITLKTSIAYARMAVTKLAPDTPAEDAAWLWQCRSEREFAVGARARGTAAEQARIFFEKSQNRQGAGLSAAFAAYAFTRAGDASCARRAADAAREILQTSSANLFHADTLVFMGFYQVSTAREAADFAPARRDFMAARAIYETFNDQPDMRYASFCLAEIQARLGDYAGAIAMLEYNAAQNRAHGHWASLREDLVNLTSYSLLAGQDATARRAGREALPLAAELDDQYFDFGAAFTSGLALLAARAGALETAVKLAGYTRNYFVPPHETMQPIEKRVWEELMSLFIEAETTGKITSGRRDEWQRAGAALSLQDALNLPLPL